jgi:hypothetical protein
MRDGNCVKPPKFDRDTILEYLDDKRGKYEQWSEEMVRAGDVQFARVMDGKLATIMMVRADVAAMEVGA